MSKCCAGPPGRGGQRQEPPKILHNDPRPRTAPKNQKVKSWISKESNDAADCFQTRVPRTRCNPPSVEPETESDEDQKERSGCFVVAEEKQEEEKQLCFIPRWPFPEQCSPGKGLSLTTNLQEQRRAIFVDIVSSAAKNLFVSTMV